MRTGLSRLTARWLLVAGVLAFAAGCEQPQSPLYVEAAGASKQITPPRIEILEADLLAIDGRRVRLANAVTPKPAPQARCPAEALAAHQAQQRMKALAQGVEAVSITPAGESDAEGHAYARVRFDGNDPAAMLIEEGLAVAPAGRPFDWCGPMSAALPQAQHIAILSWMG